MTQTTDIALAFGDDDARQETFTPFVCPRCKVTVSGPTVHGWLIDRSLHTDHFGHRQHNAGQFFAFCEVPCPECTDSARARAKADQTARLLGDSMIPQYMQGWSFNTAPDDIDKQALEKC